MSNLYNRLRETTTSGSGDGAAITSSDDIAFTPTTLFGNHSSHAIPFPGLTREWDALKKKKRKKKMREAVDAKIAQIQVDIIEEFKKIVVTSKLTFPQYVKAFNYTRDLTPPNILIDVMRKDTDLHRIESKLGDDIGELELILSDLQSGKSLAKYVAFSKFDYLVGCRLQSLPIKTITFIYDGFMDQNRTERETLTISDPDIVEALQKRGLKNKVESNQRWVRVFPIDRYFDTTFYDMVREVIHSDFEAELQTEEGSEEEANLEGGNTNDFSGGENDKSKEEVK